MRRGGVQGIRRRHCRAGLVLDADRPQVNVVLARVIGGVVLAHELRDPAVLPAACSGPTAVAPTPTAGATATPTASPTPSATPSPSASPTPGLMPIFDAHLHYSRESWTAYPPEKIAALMDSVGVRSALVSSAPDEGTFRLRAVMGDRIIPMLGPYRNGADVFSWARDGTIVAYVQSSYRAGMHSGF